MSKLVPVSRAKLIRRLRKIGFEGPFPGSDHDFMVRCDNFVRIPNYHRREIGANLIVEEYEEEGRCYRKINRCVGCFMPAKARDLQKVAKKLGFQMVIGNWLFYEILKQMNITEEDFLKLLG